MARRNTYLHNQTTLDPTQVVQLLYQQGIHDPNTLAVFVNIASRESSFRAGVHGSTDPASAYHGDMGLFQINYKHVPGLIAAGIIRQPSDLFDPVINTRAAVYLSQGGNQSAMHQLWGVTPGVGWTGTSGTLPGTGGTGQQAVQSAFSSGLVNRPYTGNVSGSQVPPMPPAVASWLASMGIDPTQLAGTQSPLTLAGLGVGTALTQSQADYARRMAGYEQGLLGLQRQGTQFDLAALGAEKQYNDALSYLNQGLTTHEQKNLYKSFKELGKNVANLQSLANRGLAQSKEYYTQSQALEQDILSTTQDWLSKQKGFTQRDYNIALQSIRHATQTEAARWNEVQRLTGSERTLAQRDFNQARGEADYVRRTRVTQAQMAERQLGREVGQRIGQTRREARQHYRETSRVAALSRDVQTRQTVSDAITRGAMTSQGTADTEREIARQFNITTSEARALMRNTILGVTEQGRVAMTGAHEQTQFTSQNAAQQYALAVSGARNDLDKQLEQITQAFNQGKISWADAQRQSTDAKARAKLTLDSQLGQLGFQGAQAGLQYRGASLQNLNQYRNAQLSGANTLEQLRHGLAQGTTDISNQAFGLQNRLLQQQAQDRYNNLMYGINQAGIGLTGQRYGIQAGQIGTQLANTTDQLWLQNAQNWLTQPTTAPFLPSPYTTGSFGGGVSGKTPGSQTSYSPYSRPRSSSPFNPQPV